MSRITKIELTQQVTRLAAENAELRRHVGDLKQALNTALREQPAPLQREERQPLAVFFHAATAYKGYEQKRRSGIPCHYEPMNVNRNGKVVTVYGLFIH